MLTFNFHRTEYTVSFFSNHFNYDTQTNQDKEKIIKYQKDKTKKKL